MCILRYVQTAPLQNLTDTHKRYCIGSAEKAARLNLVLESQGQEFPVTAASIVEVVQRIAALKKDCLSVAEIT
eukprot:1458558-Amphidinium_carterae.1